MINKIKSAAGNGKILNTYPDMTVFLGEVDGATETIRIDIEFSDEKTRIKGDRNFSLKPGQNDFSVTIQNDVAEAAVSFVIYRHSEDNDYYAMAKEKYKKAYKFYWQDTQSLALKFDYDATYKHPAGDDLPLCTNFIEIASQIFTENGIKQFSESYPFYVCVEDKHYFRDSGGGGNLTYIDTVLVPKTITDDKMVFTAQSFYCEGWPEPYSIKQNDFILVKQNGEWLVDSFTLPN